MKLLESPQDNRISGSTGQRVLCKQGELFRMETHGKTLHPRRGHAPVTVATGPPHEVDMAAQAVGERLAQFRKQRRIIPRRRSESRLQSTVFQSHFLELHQDS